MWDPPLCFFASLALRDSHRWCSHQRARKYISPRGDIAHGQGMRAEGGKGIFWKIYDTHNAAAADIAQGVWCARLRADAGQQQQRRIKKIKQQSFWRWDLRAATRRASRFSHPQNRPHTIYLRVSNVRRKRVRERGWWYGVEGGGGSLTRRVAPSLCNLLVSSNRLSVLSLSAQGLIARFRLPPLTYIYIYIYTHSLSLANRAAPVKTCLAAPKLRTQEISLYIFSRWLLPLLHFLWLTLMAKALFLKIRTLSSWLAPL